MNNSQWLQLLCVNLCCHIFALANFLEKKLFAHLKSFNRALVGTQTTSHLPPKHFTSLAYEEEKKQEQQRLAQQQMQQQQQPESARCFSFTLKC